MNFELRQLYRPPYHTSCKVQFRKIFKDWVVGSYHYGVILEIRFHHVAFNVEQDALMSPNPSGKLEDLVTVCACVV